jgi:flagellar biosynthesis/type III secretory pathway protein FliH
VVRLWQTPAEELLAFGRPGLLPLIGQTRIEQPAATIPQVVATLQQIEDRSLRTRLLASLLALTEDEEIATMIEKLSETDELFLDTPYLRHLRDKARQEGLQEGLSEGRAEGLTKGRAEGRAQGRAEGRTEGRTEGRAEGIRLTRRQDILDALILRFEFSAALYREIQKALAAIDNDVQLEQLFAAAIRSATIDDFRQALATQHAPSSAQISVPS